MTEERRLREETQYLSVSLTVESCQRDSVEHGSEWTVASCVSCVSSWA